MKSFEVRGMNLDLRRMESIEPRMLVCLNFSSWAFSPWNLRFFCHFSCWPVSVAISFCSSVDDSDKLPILSSALPGKSSGSRQTELLEILAILFPIFLSLIFAICWNFTSQYLRICLSTICSSILSLVSLEIYF
jgi:hypothetical protein